MTTIEEKEMAQDMLQMAAEALANQTPPNDKDKNKDNNNKAYHQAIQEVEDCLHALRSLEKRMLKEKSIVGS